MTSSPDLNPQQNPEENRRHDPAKDTGDLTLPAVPKEGDVQSSAGLSTEQARLLVSLRSIRGHAKTDMMHESLGNTMHAAQFLTEYAPVKTAMVNAEGGSRSIADLLSEDARSISALLESADSLMRKLQTPQPITEALTEDVQKLFHKMERQLTTTRTHLYMCNEFVRQVESEHPSNRPQALERLFPGIDRPEDTLTAMKEDIDLGLRSTEAASISARAQLSFITDPMERWPITARELASMLVTRGNEFFPGVVRLGGVSQDVPRTIALNLQLTVRGAINCFENSIRFFDERDTPGNQRAITVDITRSDFPGMFEITFTDNAGGSARVSEDAKKAGARDVLDVDPATGVQSIFTLEGTTRKGGGIGMAELQIIARALGGFCIAENVPNDQDRTGFRTRMILPRGLGSSE